ncbi:MAG: single-stranded-DNA-specific exonuclease RecJ [Candidatus Omnitrophica bacterium]|nr:single-stranded-DNA-specific exonuclease RecJ [Candidatus Omnitrophota bacterium]
MHKLWVVKKPQKVLQEKLTRETGISPTLAHLLINRNLTTPTEIEGFLHCKKSSLHNPFKLKGITKAVGRIKRAIKQKEKILIYGDYDVDGITSVAMLTTFLEKEGGLVESYIPNRLEEGYGLNTEAIKLAKSKGVSLVIAVDCGTTDKEEIDLLNRYKIDTIIVDHHQVQKELMPNAFSLINPLQPGCDYPFKELSGVGLAYKLICAISDDTQHNSEEFLDLVALGTVADVVSQTGENRILTKLGLGKLSISPRVGLKALMDAAGLSRKDIQAEHISFILGPRINVAGRIGSPELALKLIMTEEKDKAKELAEVLNQKNSHRRKLQDEILKKATSEILDNVNFKDQRVIVVWGEDWHLGVIGIVASKIVDRFYRPAIVLSIQKNIARGSGRSIEKFHLFEAVYKCKDLLENFGGHEAACGITIAKDKIEQFRDSINDVAHKMLKTDDLVPRIEVDAQLSLSCITKKFIGELRLLEPFGVDNPQPLFMTSNLKMKNSPTRLGKSGIKMWVTDKKITCEAMCFNAYDMFEGLQDLNSVDLVYYPRIREISGVSTFKLEIEDLKPN